MKTIDQRTKCTNTHIQQGKVQTFTNNFVIRKDYIEKTKANGQNLDKTSLLSVFS